MDARLMAEFEEFEGLGDQTSEEIKSDDNDIEDDPSFRPVNASTLTSSDIYYEMDKRGIKTTGFPDTDRERLQTAFDEEFKRDLEHEKVRRREIKRRAAQQESLMKRRLLMEKTLQEEQDELARNHQISKMIDFLKENLVGQSLRIDINSVSARSFAKALWINNTITCLDLSSNELNDHAGTYLARVLKRNNTLRKLELDNNKLGPKTCQAFGESLKSNTSLEYLSLDSTQLCGSDSKPDVSGIKALADALRANKTLISLNLWRTGIPSEAGYDLASAIEENNSILFCDVNHNGINMSDVKRISDKLDANLAAFEARERRGRLDALDDAEKLKKRVAEEASKRKDAEVAKWLEDKRNERAQMRRAAEEEKVLTAQAEAEEKKRVADKEREAAKKAAEEVAAKKGAKGKKK